MGNSRGTLFLHSPWTISLVVLLSSVCSSSAWTCSSDSRGVLLEFRSAFSDPANKVFASWDSGVVDCCTWTGVTCQDGAVTMLDIEGPPGTGSDQVTRNESYSESKPGYSLYKLQDLQTLKVQNLQFSSKIPSQWSAFSNNMVSITINNCDLQDNIPSSIGNIDKLQHLDLKSNSLSGSIPSALCNLKYLNYLDLSYNQLDTSSVPDCIQNGGAITNVNYGHQSSNSSSSGGNGGSGGGSGGGNGGSGGGSGGGNGGSGGGGNPPYSYNKGAKCSFNPSALQMLAFCLLMFFLVTISQ